MPLTCLLLNVLNCFPCFGSSYRASIKCVHPPNSRVVKQRGSMHTNTNGTRACTMYLYMQDVKKYMWRNRQWNIDSKSYYTEGFSHQEMVTSHSSYNTLPLFCAEHSLHTAQLVSVEQWDSHWEMPPKWLLTPPVDRDKQQRQQNWCSITILNTIYSVHDSTTPTLTGQTETYSKHTTLNSGIH